MLKRIVGLHKRCLRVLYSNNLRNYDKRLVLENSASVHHRKLHCLTIDWHQAFNGIFSPDIMKDISTVNATSNFDMRNRKTIYAKLVTSIYKITSYYYAWPLKYGN